jgi:hypothetical protein
VPRNYSPEFVESLKTKGIHDGIGVVLAKRCVKANIPTTLVSRLIGVSRQTVHTWFRGGTVSSGRVQYLEALIRIIDSDLAKGVLPLTDYKSIEAYYESLTSGPV